MTDRPTTPTSHPVADLFPPAYRDALVYAGRAGDHRLIDEVTDELARLGLCRPRSACADITPPWRHFR